MELEVIAHVRTDFKEKFGIPRQSGMVEELEGLVVFEKKYRNPDALRGIEEFSHLWLLWEFSKSKRDSWSATVRPPRLGGNERVGVFATRSPFRPNAIGLSCVRLLGIEEHPTCGHTLRIAGVDMLDGTPIFDIKPYIPHADRRMDATGGFSDRFREYALEVIFPETEMAKVPTEKRAALMGILKGDPRPSYQDDPDRVYGLSYADMEIKFKAAEGKLTVLSVSADCGR